ncbi:hypothetical protein LCGC14_1299560 [marine sediment metagenome]|uniref:Phage protein n=1 Tax=marine sediment metagenome TaxID=412755 RepID=A0A0F9N6L6_9ZZZZ
MAKFRKNPVVVEAITFDELVSYGRTQTHDVVHGGMPWSFSYEGQPITHENDNCYIIPTYEGPVFFTRDDMLITGVDCEIHVCNLDIFEKTYEPVGE